MPYSDTRGHFNLREFNFSYLQCLLRFCFKPRSLQGQVILHTSTKILVSALLVNIRLHYLFLWSAPAALINEALPASRSGATEMVEHAEEILVLLDVYAQSVHFKYTWWSLSETADRGVLSMSSSI